MIPEGAKVTTYRNGNFLDPVPPGPHVENTGAERRSKLTHFAGAYWLGSEKNEMLQRIYGTAFASQADLDAPQRIEESLKRDHRKLGRELDLFSIHEEVGAGPCTGTRSSPWCVTCSSPSGRKSTQGATSSCTRRTSRARSSTRIRHLQNYGDIMYAPMQVDEQAFRVKPMNRLNHIMIYNSRKHSYRELPVRFAELGTAYRYERPACCTAWNASAAFTGGTTPHIFCTPDQLQSGDRRVLKFMPLLSTCGYEYHCYPRDASGRQIGIGSDAEWTFATNALRAGAETAGLPTRSTRAAARSTRR